MKHTLSLLLALAAVVSFPSCTANAPKAKFAQAMSASDNVTASDRLNIKATPAASDVPLTSLDGQRIAALVNKKVAASGTAGARRNLTVDISITRYDKGNAFARAMLAGLGQIHIDGVTTVRDGSRTLGQFTVKKTFALGGIYGAGVTIQDCEDGFAKGIAEALTGRTLK
jgi:hypothetical protein